MRHAARRDHRRPVSGDDGDSAPTRCRSSIASCRAIRSTASRSTVPLPLLNQLTDARLTWLVPGMVREKVTHYLKALPKAVAQSA